MFLYAYFYLVWHIYYWFQGGDGWTSGNKETMKQLCITKKDPVWTECSESLSWRWVLGELLVSVFWGIVWSWSTTISQYLIYNILYLLIACYSMIGTNNLSHPAQNLRVSTSHHIWELTQASGPCGSLCCQIVHLTDLQEYEKWSKRRSWSHNMRLVFPQSSWLWMGSCDRLPGGLVHPLFAMIDMCLQKFNSASATSWPRPRWLTSPMWTCQGSMPATTPTECTVTVIEVFLRVPWYFPEWVIVIW